MAAKRHRRRKMLRSSRLPRLFTGFEAAAESGTRSFSGAAVPVGRYPDREHGRTILRLPLPLSNPS